MHEHALDLTLSPLDSPPADLGVDVLTLVFLLLAATLLPGKLAEGTADHWVGIFALCIWVLADAS